MEGGQLMDKSVFGRYSHWLLPAFAALTVVLAGARLITLSVRDRAEQMRVAAHDVTVRHARSIEAELRALAERTQREAQRAAAAMGGQRTAAALAASLTPAPGTLWITSERTLLRAAPAEAATATAIASEAPRADASARAGAAALFGPIRYGSQWLVAARAPIAPAAALWAVGYENLEALLARARFGTLVDEGYDFQLYQLDAPTRAPRVFLTSQPAALDAPATSAVRAPGEAGHGAASAPSNAARSPAGDFLVLAVRPRAGWYPARELTAEVGLLALVTWALAFGLYDLTHSLRRTRAMLAAIRKRLHSANERLVSEIEQRESLQKSIEHARYHDAFTGLPNRRYFMDQLDRALREIRTRRRRRLAIVLVDIERFKLISDTLGHTAGDELLLQAAQRCASVLGGVEHLLARWGGSQLAVLAYEVESVAASQALANQLLEVRHEPFELRQHRISVTSRVGFTCIESGVQRAEEALREADLALSVAKQQQTQRAVGYVTGMAGAAVSLVSLEADLHVALDRNEFRLLFLPVVDLRRQRVVGAEALLRWRHPVEGLLTPDKFLSIAEETGVIVPVTRWVIQRVCRMAAEWRQRLPPGTDFYISVNLSAAVLRAPGLRDFVARVLQETGLPAIHLKFEMTEGGLVSNVTMARTVLEALHELGIEMMLDDFGTGYSSLSYLQLFPFDYVKIDRPFVSRTGSERANTAITSAILQVGSNLGLRAIAEIVETKAAAEMLAQMGCEFAQGYFFSPAVEAEEAFRQLRSSEILSATVAESDDATMADPLVEEEPTLVLPPGVVLESKITDESASSEEENTGEQPESAASH
jgi:diguanylate cyclase (GGDEF)-like protein